MLFLASCADNKILSKNDKDFIKCRLELYCTKSEDSIVKKAAFTVIEIYFGTELNDGICEKHYQPWGYDYRVPVHERCGLDGDFEKRPNQRKPNEQPLNLI